MENKSTYAVPAFGYEIIRDHLISSILGKHEDEILYWAGKDLARKFPLFSMNEAHVFFKEAGWGELYLEKESKDEAIYHLVSESIPLNINDRCFHLEAGFLAAQQERNIGFMTECYNEKNVKQNNVIFKLKWDLKEPIGK
jgi:predicted hydrocarbon binding protein